MSFASFVVYVLSVSVGLILHAVYREREEKADPRHDELHHGPKKKREISILAMLGIQDYSADHFYAFEDHFQSFQEVSRACKRAGLEKCELIIGVDFTASNEWQGRKTFSGHNLHRIVAGRVYNPYQKVISILGQTLQPFDDDELIPCYGFGDSVTLDTDVFPFTANEAPCNGFSDVLDHYNEIAKKVMLSGPTNFAPVINKAIEIVKQAASYHILIIIADGQVNVEAPTIQAIVDASQYPISIIMVGVGDGPWETMEEFDDNLPKRKFDNFQFVNYHNITSKAKHPDVAFALHALMEIPDQYKTIKAFGYIGEEAKCSKSKQKYR